MNPITLFNVHVHCVRIHQLIRRKGVHVNVASVLRMATVNQAALHFENSNLLKSLMFENEEIKM